MRIGLAAVVLAIAATPSTLAAEKPRPDALWDAFPLEPARERPASPPLLPPAQERTEATTVTEVATTVTDTPSEASRPSTVVLASAALLLLLATVGVLSGRRLYVNRRRSSSAPLWQGVTWPQASDEVQQLEASSVRTISVFGNDAGAAEPHPDVLAPRYRWADDAPARRSRPSLTSKIGAMAHRARTAVWNEDTAPAIFGAGIAVVVGLLLVYIIG